jgi:FKBP-type peptidyl-prolyl cis-trans isomerase 2
MQQAKPGDRVTVNYIGTLDNGYVFDSREEDAPLEITLGKNEVFSALESGIIGMKVGEVKNIEIGAEDAFGPRRQENIISLPRNNFPAEKEIKPGTKLIIQFRDESEKVMLVREVDEESVVLDGNHALAGLDLTFALKLVAIHRE